jgi:hypothetical protein
MAIGTPAVLSTATANSHTVTSTSFTPTANALLVVDYGAHIIGVTGSTPTCVDSSGLTWTLGYSGLRDPGTTTSRQRVACWTARAPASPVAMTVTCTCTSTITAGNRSLVSVREVTGASATTNSATAVSASGRAAPVLPATPAASSIVLQASAMFGANPVAPPSGSVESSEILAATNFTLETSYATAPAAATWTYPVNGNAGCVGGGIEIAAATSGSTAGFTENVTPTDSVGSVGVAVSLGFTEIATATDSTGPAQIPSDTSPENPAGVWVGAAAAWKMPGGTDSKGINALTVSGITATTLNGAPAGTFTAASYARRNVPTFAAMAALTVETTVQATTVGGRIFRIGSDTVAKCIVWVETTGEITLARTVGANTQTSVTAAGVGTTALQHITAIFPANGNHVLYINGALVGLTHTGTAINGSLSIASDDVVSIGDPPVTGSTGFIGKIGRTVLWPLAFTATRATASFRHNFDPRRWVGIGGEDQAGDTNHAPVAVPTRFDGTTAVATTINVRPRSYDPDAGDTISIQGTPTTTSGTVSVTGGNLVITSAAAFTGELQVSFQLGDGSTKRSSSKVYGTIAAPTTSMVCVDDPNLVVTEDTAKTLNVLANDTPATGTTVISVTQPATTAGRVTIPAGGDEVLFTPVTDYTGPFSFTYTAKHTASNTTDTATVSGRVEEANAMPWWRALKNRTKLSGRTDNGVFFGSSYMENGSNFDAHRRQYETLVCKLDCFNGNYFEDKPSENNQPGWVDSQTYTTRRMFGGPLFSASGRNTTIDPDGQLNFKKGQFGEGWYNLPAGTLLSYSLDFIGYDRRTSGGDHSIWGEIWNGTRGLWDEDYINLGARLGKLFDALPSDTNSLNPKGHTSEYFFIRMFHENNQTNYYQVPPAQKLNYKRAAERIITKVRQGANLSGNHHGDKIRFGHAPAHGQTLGDYGDYLSWCPDNVDFLSVSWHPNQSCTTEQKCKDYNRDTSTGDVKAKDVLEACITAGKPAAFPEHEPRHDNCPMAGTVYRDFHALINEARYKDYVLYVAEYWTKYGLKIDGTELTSETAKAQWNDYRKAIIDLCGGPNKTT